MHNRVPENRKIIIEISQQNLETAYINLVYVFFQPGKNNSQLIGSLDIGGGSAEVTFVPESPSLPDKYTSTTSLYGVNYTLYSHSYLCYGFKEAQRRLMAHLLEVRISAINYF